MSHIFVQNLKFRDFGIIKKIIIFLITTGKLKKFCNKNMTSYGNQKIKFTQKGIQYIYNIINPSLTRGSL